LGCWQFGSKGSDDYWGLEYTDQLASDVVKQSIAEGVTYCDVAEDYQKGGAEEQLGLVLKDLEPQQRNRVIIGSKILPNNCGKVRDHCVGTLSRLGISCIDLYMVHWPISANSMSHFTGTTTSTGNRDYSSTGEVDPSSIPPTTQAFRELMALQAEGKIRYIGVSNFGVLQLTEALATGATIVVNQICYNLIFRAAELSIIPFCKEHKIGIFAYSPLMQGLLTSEYTNANQVPVYRARTRHFNGKRDKSRHGEEGHEQLLFETLVKLRDISKEHGISMLEMALSWPLHNDAVTCVIAGATKISHVTSNCNSITKKLSPEILKKIDEVTSPLKTSMGDNCDLWQGRHADGRDDRRIQ